MNSQPKRKNDEEGKTPVSYFCLDAPIRQVHPMEIRRKRSVSTAVDNAEPRQEIDLGIYIHVAHRRGHIESDNVAQNKLLLNIYTYE
jgi:hypothetical protein